MGEVFQLRDRSVAEEYLCFFDSDIRNKGEDYIRQGRVLDLFEVEPGFAYAAKVRGGSQVFSVQLLFDPVEGWVDHCTCGAGELCEHSFAALKTLLAEDSVARVRDISRGKTEAIQPVNHADRTLAGKLKESLGREMNADEATYAQTVAEIWEQVKETRQIYFLDLQRLGLQVDEYSWRPMKVWNEFPVDEYEFWLCLALYSQKIGRVLPPYLREVSHDPDFVEKNRRWQRKQDIKDWRQRLQSNGQNFEEPIGEPTSVVELRLRFDEVQALLEWRSEGATEFKKFTQKRLGQLESEIELGRTVLSVEAELIWNHSRQRYYTGALSRLAYDAPADRKALSKLLRLQIVERYLVGLDGLPLRRHSEPLCWDMSPAKSKNDDYRFRLVKANGSAAPKTRMVVNGAPPLYLTDEGVYPGPRSTDALDPSSETKIPAPALEEKAGVSFLRELGLEMPPRLRDRIKTVGFKTAIRCKLGPLSSGSKAEACFVKVTAQSTDGKVKEHWIGSGWAEPRRSFGTRSKSRSGSKGQIVVYDRSCLREIPRLMKVLELRFDLWTLEGNVKVTRKFPEIFVEWLKTIPPEIKVDLKGELASLARDPVAGRVKLEVEETEIDWFDLQVVLDVSDTELSPEELKLLLDARGKWVRLVNKGWRRLHFDLSDEEDEQLASLGLNPHELTSERQRLHALQLANPAAKRFLDDRQAEAVHRRAEEIQARVTPGVPEGIKADLRPYQLEGFHFLAYLSANRFGGILADDMGLGKTVQTLTWLAWLLEQPRHRGQPSLVVCPKSVMDNWCAEADRFLPGLRVRLWAARDLKNLVNGVNEADLHVLNYNQLRLVGESLSVVHWLSLILDEGQFIKNPNSQTAQVARSLRADHRMVLTGTPIENRLLDLWSLMSFAMPGILGSRAQFGRIYDAKDDPFARLRLSSRVRPFLLRRTKSQVAEDLPDRIEEDLYCEIEGEQRKLYQAELKRAQQMLLKVNTQKQLAKQQFNFLTSLLRLRQICCHSKLVNPKSRAISAKVEALLEQVEPIVEEGQKVLVFSQFVEMLDLLKTAINERGWPHFYLAGQTENRGKLVKEFQDTEGSAVFLISLKAGGFGLNLMAASYVFLFDPWWNPAVENQAIDRTHRIGQTNNVIAYRLLIKDSIEEKIRRLQKQKSALAKDVLGEEKFSQSLTLEDFRFLFAD